MFSDPASGARWIQRFLGAGAQGDDILIMMRKPAPDVTELLTIAATSQDSAEVVADHRFFLDIAARAQALVPPENGCPEAVFGLLSS
jgi:hypothetical protein